MTAGPGGYDQQNFFVKFLINILMMLTGKLDADNKGNNSLIGLISKHGILMVEFANELQQREGLDRRSAIVKAAAIRLRPIQAVFDRFVRFLIQGNVLRGEVYPLSVAAERTQQALSAIEVARAVGASAIAHGSTGAGNDQVRFDIAFRVLAPELEILTPIRELGLQREQAIAYLEERKLPVPPKAGAYSINRGLWGTTWGAAGPTIPGPPRRPS